jgi:hypothetical protein
VWPGPHGGIALGIGASANCCARSRQSREPELINFGRVTTRSLERLSPSRGLAASPRSCAASYSSANRRFAGSLQPQAGLPSEHSDIESHLNGFDCHKSHRQHGD